MSESSLKFDSPRIALKLFFAILVSALIWAAYTDHIWEDYFITFRASQNLAEGNGLVFQEGERLHTFTSPLGVLLPALCHVITGSASEIHTLWLFRFMGAIALGGVVALVALTLKNLFPHSGRAGWLIGIALIVGLEAKTIDYATNGMETPFLLLGFAWTWWALVVRPIREVAHLGGAMALLMWGRPDSFIYIAAIVGAAWWFQTSPAANFRRTRLIQFFRAGMITTVLYLPWLVWSGWYYGTPIPHTVAAKGLFGSEHSLWMLIVKFPQHLWERSEILAATFLPPYAVYVDWPAWMNWLMIPAALVAMFLWLIPKLTPAARIASFTAFVGQFYLISVVGFGVPWYLPTVTFFSSLALGLSAWQLSQRFRRQNFVRRRIAVQSGFSLFIALILVNAVMAAYQLRWQQRLIEWGNRRVIGEWLRDNAATPEDTVFLECLGYIGYFSNLKMLDFPGLSSPEVVASRLHAGSRAYPDCWHELIQSLEPDWVVLRDWELEKVRHYAPDLLFKTYQLAKVFDVTEAIAAVPILPGRGYLTGDGRFHVFRRTAAKSSSLEYPVFRTRLEMPLWYDLEAWGQPPYASGQDIVSHAPASMTVALDLATPRELIGAFGLYEGAYANPPDVTDGAGFVVWGRDESGEELELWSRQLRPSQIINDRGRQVFRLPVPEGVYELRLEINNGGGSNSFDWGYWAELQLVAPLWPSGFRGTWEPAAGPALVKIDSKTN